MPIADRGLWSQAGARAGCEAQSAPVPAAAAAPENLPTSPRRDRRADPEPLTSELSRVHVTVPREFLPLLQAARDALSHTRPGASDGEILVEGLKAIVERCAKRRGIVKPTGRRSAAIPGAAGADGGTPDIARNHATATLAPRRREHIPAHVRRAVWERDGGRCSFPLESGGVCGSTFQLEFDHITPVALGATRRSTT